MRRALILTLGTALCAVPVAFAAHAADKPAASAKAPYKAPKNAFGQPDLGDVWSNATLTPESRPASLGDRAVYTPEEVKKMEAAVQTEVEEGNRATDPNASDRLPSSLATTRSTCAPFGMRPALGTLIEMREPSLPDTPRPPTTTLPCAIA